MNVLVINCGSSSLKYQVIESESGEVKAKGLCERIGIDGKLKYSPAGRESEVTDVAMPDHTTAVKLVLEALTNPKTGILKSLDEIDAVGHRVVHGGEKFSDAVVITEEVINAVKECNDLAPLHNPANIIGINACRELMPNTPMVGVFDTAFHATMPEKAYLYAIPHKYYDDYKARRYGFHGTSHSYVSKRVAEIAKKPYESLKTIVCHLGNGASVCAVLNGKSVDTSMGLSPLEGLIMGTRSGDVDPSVIEFIAKKDNLSLNEAISILNKKSGMLGMTGISSDFRDVIGASKQGDARATAALDAYCYRVAKYVGAYAAAMNGVDCIAFTAGVGENNSFIRDKICKYFGYLGITLDEEANTTATDEKLISTKDSKVAVYVVPTNEELAIARQTVELLK